MTCKLHTDVWSKNSAVPSLAWNRQCAMALCPSFKSLLCSTMLYWPWTCVVSSLICPSRCLNFSRQCTCVVLHGPLYFRGYVFRIWCYTNMVHFVLRRRRYWMRMDAILHAHTHTHGWSMLAKWTTTVSPRHPPKMQWENEVLLAWKKHMHRDPSDR